MTRIKKLSCDCEAEAYKCKIPELKNSKFSKYLFLKLNSTCTEHMQYWTTNDMDFLSMVEPRCDNLKLHGKSFVSEPEFVNFQGAQESIPPAYVAWWAGTSNKIGLSYRPARLGIDSWGSGFANTGSELQWDEARQHVLLCVFLYCTVPFEHWRKGDRKSAFLKSRLSTMWACALCVQ